MPEIISIRETDEDWIAYATDPHWVFALEDGKNRQFGLVVEAIDLAAAGVEGEDDTEFPICVEISIVAHDPSDLYRQERYGGWPGIKAGDRLALIEAAYSYGVGVPVTHILHDVKHGDKPKGLVGALDGVDPETYKIFDRVARYGTVAAQRGETTLSFPRFRIRAWDDLRVYVDNMIGRAQVLGIMIGFILDRPINLAGEDGWSVMRRWVNGPHA